MNSEGQWTISPAYDLTFSSGPGGEHCTSIMGNGRHPGIFDLLKLAMVAKINVQRAHVIIDDVKQAVSKWGQFAKEAFVSKQSSRNIQTKLSEIK